MKAIHVSMTSSKGLRNKKKRNQENRIIRSAAEAPGFYALVSMTIGHRSKIGFLCERRQENSK